MHKAATRSIDIVNFIIFCFNNSYEKTYFPKWVLQLGMYIHLANFKSWSIDQVGINKSLSLHEKAKGVI